MVPKSTTNNNKYRNTTGQKGYVKINTHPPPSTPAPLPLPPPSLSKIDSNELLIQCNID